MTADDLRAVAAEIRHKANGFIAEDNDPPRVDIDQYGTCDSCAQGRHLVASYPDDDSEPWLCKPCAAFADHTAAWTRRSVALAVADWLESELNHPFGPPEHAIAFCKAWRGES